MRQPHSRKASSPSTALQARITPSDSSRPIEPVVWMKLVKNPRRGGVQCSAM